MNEILITINGVTESINQNAAFVLENAENMRWGKLELATTTNPFVDGDFVQNKRGMPRDITLTLRFLNATVGAEAAKEWFCTAFNHQVTLTWVGKGENNTNWTIQGIVDEIDEDTKTNSSILTINLHCSNPYWEGEEITVNYVPDANETPLDIVFKGNTLTGFTVDFSSDIYRTPENETYAAFLLNENEVDFRSETYLPNDGEKNWRYSTVRGDRHFYEIDQDEATVKDNLVQGFFVAAEPNVSCEVILRQIKVGVEEFAVPFTLKYKPRYI